MDHILFLFFVYVLFCFVLIHALNFMVDIGPSNLPPSNLPLSSGVTLRSYIALSEYVLIKVLCAN